MKQKVKTKYMKQKIELFQNWHNRFKTETASLLLKVYELLSVQQTNIPKINSNTDKPIKKLQKSLEARKTNGTINKITKFHWVMHLKLFPSKNARTNLNLLLRATHFYLPLIMILVKKDEKQSTKRQNRPEAYITNNQHEEPLEQNNPRLVAGKR